MKSALGPSLVTAIRDGIAADERGLVPLTPVPLAGSGWLGHELAAAGVPAE